MTKSTVATIIKQPSAGLSLIRQPVYASDFGRLIYPFSPSERKLIMRACRLSRGYRRPENRGQKFEHSQLLAVLLINLGVRDVYAIIAALLHDVLSDYILELEDIEDIFGPLASGTIQIVCKLIEENLTKEQYFARLLGADWHSRWRSWLVTCADRLHNLSVFYGTSEAEKRLPEKKIERVAEIRQYVIPIAVALSELPQFKGIGKFFVDALTEWCDFREAETLAV